MRTRPQWPPEYGWVQLGTFSEVIRFPELLCTLTLVSKRELLSGLCLGQRLDNRIFSSVEQDHHGQRGNSDAERGVTWRRRSKCLGSGLSGMARGVPNAAAQTSQLEPVYSMEKRKLTRGTFPRKSREHRNALLAKNGRRSHSERRQPRARLQGHRLTLHRSRPGETVGRRRWPDPRHHPSVTLPFHLSYTPRASSLSDHAPVFASTSE